MRRGRCGRGALCAWLGRSSARAARGSQVPPSPRSDNGSGAARAGARLWARRFSGRGLLVWGNVPAKGAAVVQRRAAVGRHRTSSACVPLIDAPHDASHLASSRKGRTKIEKMGGCSMGRNVCSVVLHALLLLLGCCATLRLQSPLAVAVASCCCSASLPAFSVRPCTNWRCRRLPLALASSSAKGERCQTGDFCAERELSLTRVP